MSSGHLADLQFLTVPLRWKSDRCFGHDDGYRPPSGLHFKNHLGALCLGAELRPALEWTDAANVYRYGNAVGSTGGIDR